MTGAHVAGDPRPATWPTAWCDLFGHRWLLTAFSRTGDHGEYSKEICTVCWTQRTTT